MFAIIIQIAECNRPNLKHVNVKWALNVFIGRSYQTHFMAITKLQQNCRILGQTITENRTQLILADISVTITVIYSIHKKGI